MERAWLAMIFGVVACSRAGAFACQDDTECSSAGQCESNGACSESDDECRSGRRYAPSAGDLAGTCVPSEEGDTSTSAATTTTSGPTTGGTTASPTSVADTGPIGDWWDPAWEWRVRVGLRNSNRNEDLQDFPVLVTLFADSVDFDSIVAGGDDLRFVDPDGTELAYEIDAWSDADSRGAVWVRVPQIEAGSDSDHFYMYYGNPDAPRGQSPSDVWAEEFGGVWHLDPGLSDSTEAGIDGANLGAAGVVGQIGAALRFDGMGSMVQLGPAASLDSPFLVPGGGTVTAWLFPEGAGNSSSPRIFDKAGDTSPGGFNLAWRPGDSRFHFAQGFSSGLAMWLTPTQSVQQRQWTFVAVVYDAAAAGTVPAIYIDGQQVTLSVNSSAAGIPDPDVQWPLTLGNHHISGVRSFMGLIDEVRVIRQARSADWIDATYAAATGELAALGPPQQLGD